MDQVLQVVERSNQRGGRMLSVVDLVRAGTLGREQAGWLLARILEGSSWLVGARPGGAGKTAIMSALLAMLPGGEEVRLAVPGSGWEASPAGACVVAYEIGPGGYDAYLWGREVRALCRLAASGCRVVTNLHADTLRQARAQVVDECGADPRDFDAFDLFLPIALRRRGGSSERRVRSVYQCRAGNWAEVARAQPLRDEELWCARFIASCLRAGRVTCPDVRAAWLRALAGGKGGACA